MSMSKHISETHRRPYFLSWHLQFLLEDTASTPPPLISGSIALTFLQDLTHYFHSPPVLPERGSSSMNISGLAKPP